MALLKRALVIGDARCVFDDLGYTRVSTTLSELLRRFDLDLVVGVNRAALRFPVRLWASLHPELFHRERGGPGWLSEWPFRDDLPELWGPASKPTRGVRPLETAGRGSSGFFGVEVALALGADRVVLAGIPMTATPHVDDDRPWDAANAHLREWTLPETLARFDGRVRSLSGATRDLLGEPDPAWWTGLQLEE